MCVAGAIVSALSALLLIIFVGIGMAMFIGQ